MDKETFQKLVSIYNMLYNMTVVGDAVIPMARALTLLQSILGPEMVKANEENHAEDKNEEVTDHE